MNTCCSCWCHWSSPIIWRWKTTGAESRLNSTGSPMLFFTKGWRSEFSCRRKADWSLKPTTGPEIHLWKQAEQPIWWTCRHASSLPALRAAALMSNVVSEGASFVCPPTLWLPAVPEDCRQAKGFAAGMRQRRATADSASLFWKMILYLKLHYLFEPNQPPLWSAVTQAGERRVWSCHSLNKLMETAINLSPGRLWQHICGVPSM